VNLEDLVENAFSAISVPENIEAVCDVEPNLKIKSDPSYLRRMITNLCNNAIQAMPNGGKLTLTAKVKGEFLEMTVSDTGEGIPEELKEKMFKPLFTTKAKGQGFGLAVVKKFAEQLGGTITFDSQVGKGTTFRIQLPFTQESNQSAKQ
jgi:signal transduction histidine kinase